MRMKSLIEVIALVMLHVVFYTWVYPDSSSYSNNLPLIPNIGLSCRCKLAKLVSNHILSNGHLMVVLSIVHLELKTDEIGQDGG
jgi:hypothetical protein